MKNPDGESPEDNNFRYVFKHELRKSLQTYNGDHSIHIVITEAKYKAMYMIDGKNAHIPKEYLEKFLEEEHSNKTEE